MPAISPEVSPSYANAADSYLPDSPSSGSVQPNPEDGDILNEAAILLGSVAKMLTPDSSKGKIGQSARADLIRSLDALESTFRERADGGSGGEDRIGQEIRNAPTGDAAALDGSAAHKIETAERFALEPCRSSMPAESTGEPREGPHFSTLPSLGVDRVGQDVPLQQIEAAHTRLSEQLQAGFAAATAETSALSAAVLSAMEKVGLPRGEDLSQQARAALEQASETLTQRLDLAASNFASVTAIEKSIGELSVHLDEIRQSVTGIATANEQTLRILSGSGATQQAILDAIASLRALHEDTATRATVAWTSIQASLERVAGLSARLEAAGTRDPADGPSTEVDPNDPFLPLLAQQGDTGPQLNGTGTPRTNADAAAQSGGPYAIGGIDDSGFQNEFGHGFVGAKENREPPGQTTPLPTIFHERDDNRSRTDFITAARRAARTAQLEVQGSAPAQEGETHGWEKLASLFHLGNRVLATYRRPIAVGTVILLALVVALALGRLLILDRAGDFLPAFLRLFHGAAVSKSQASDEMGSAADSVNMTAAISPLPPVSPVAASSANPNGKMGAPKIAPAASNVRAASNLPDPLAPPEGFVSQDGPGGGARSALRAISGSGAIVAAAMQRMKQITSPGPGITPAPPAPIVLSPPSKAQSHLPFSGSGTAIASVGADRPPGGSDKDLLARAQAGDPAAQFDLAAHYAEDFSSKENLALAAQWYEKAAQQGHAVAEYRLASFFEKGHGVTKDLERAKDLYQRAAEKGNIRAMHNLGVLAAEGSDGKPNYTSAALWFSKAAGYGIKDSQYNFAVLLARGLGVTKDLVRSYTWFAIVAATGDADAARKRDEVAARLTNSELSAANAAAAAFVPGTPDTAANEPAPPSPGQEAAKPKAGPNKSKVSGL